MALGAVRGYAFYQHGKHMKADADKVVKYINELHKSTDRIAEGEYTTLENILIGRCGSNYFRFVKYRELTEAINQLSNRSGWHWGDAYRANQIEKRLSDLNNDKHLIIKSLVKDGTYTDEFSALADYNKWTQGRPIHESIEAINSDSNIIVLYSWIKDK